MDVFLCNGLVFLFRECWKVSVYLGESSRHSAEPWILSAVCHGAANIERCLGALKAMRDDFGNREVLESTAPFLVWEGSLHKGGWP